MAIPEHVARLRAAVGHDLLLLPSVSALVFDGAGRLLLVRHVGHDDGWGVPGGVVEIGESPGEAIVRELREEIGVKVRLCRLVDVVGGPEFTVSYPNGDRATFMAAVYQAEITQGVPAADLDEIEEIGWFTLRERLGVPLNPFSKALLTATGQL